MMIDQFFLVIEIKKTHGKSDLPNTLFLLYTQNKPLQNKKTELK